MKRIVLTGGGTAGHVTPNIALIPKLKQADYEVIYIGSDGIEKELIEKLGITYYTISAGKFRRYKNLKNFMQNVKDVFNVLNGISQAKKYIKELKPDIVFSKGGFVAVPVVLAAKRYKVPVVVHESDITPGLANKIAIPKAEAVCTTFPETVQYIGSKAICTGTPIRKEIFEGDITKGMKFCNFEIGKPVILVMGGSLGAAKINKALRESLPTLLEKFQIVHLCGKGKKDGEFEGIKGYVQFEYIADELPDIMACTDMVISRAGSNSISEFLALKKPSLLIPLNARASRGDQILNAQSFEKQGFSKMIDEDVLTPEVLVEAIDDLYQNKRKYIDSMDKSDFNQGIDNVLEVIKKYSR